MQETYLDNYFTPTRRRLVHNDEVVCAVLGCTCQPDAMPKSRKDLTGIQAGKQLYKAYCPAHTHIFDYTFKGKYSWSSNKKQDGLWCRMPIFFELLGLDTAFLNCNHDQAYLKKELALLQDVIDYGTREEATTRAGAFNVRFTNEHVFGSKEYGADYTVCVCSNCANTKTMLFGDNKSHQEKANTSFYSKLINSLTDDALADKMLINSWTMSESIESIKGSV